MTTLTAPRAKTFKDLDTYFVLPFTGDQIGGYIIWDRYIDLNIADLIVRHFSSIPMNTCGEFDVFTTNPEIKKVIPNAYFVDKEELETEEVESLFDYIFIDGDYDIGDADSFGAWYEGYIGGKDDDITEALEKYGHLVDTNLFLKAIKN